MLLNEKEEEILNCLSNQRGPIAIHVLAKQIFLSEQSIRRYLDILAKKKLVIRTHGGAMINYENTQFPQGVPLYIRSSSMSEEKKIIAQKASKFLFDGATIFLDNSSTAFHLLPHFKFFKNITIITYGVKTIITACEMGFNTICLGGTIDLTNFSSMGIDTVNEIKKYYADIAFFSSSGLSEDGLLTDHNKNNSLIRTAIMQQSKMKIYMVEDSKLNKTLSYGICSLADVDYCFCNIELEENLQNKTKGAKV